MSLPSWERGLKCYALHEKMKESTSLPSWERGLKFLCISKPLMLILVAPLVGAWIEISTTPFNSAGGYCRSPRGSVD